MPDLLGNFSHMAVFEKEWINQTVSNNVNASYQLVGRPQVNGTQGYEVNFTDDVVSSEITANDTGTIWFVANGTATEMNLGSSQLSGYYAALEGELLMAPFDVVFEVGSVFNETTISNLPSSAYSILNETTITLGSLKANQTDYSFTSSFLDNMTASESACTPLTGINYTEFVTGVSKVPGINFDIFTLFYTDGNVNGTSIGVFLQVTSLAETQ